MIQITLETHEATILGEILEAYLSDLRMEIADTDRKDFRETLKERKDVIKELLKVLPKRSEKK